MLLSANLPILVFVLYGTWLWDCVCGHAFLEEPRQRGILEKNPFTTPIPIVENLPEEVYDHRCHWPAGNDSSLPGSAVMAQRSYGNQIWTPYEPSSPGFVFRSGVCGDEKFGIQHHLRGGKYYYPAEKAQIVASYVQGGVLNATITVVKHHNGFIEFTLCDIKLCDGEISEDCLRNPLICKKLNRAYERRCEEGNSADCGPIDPNYPTRWHLPCSTEKIQVYTNIMYQLPDDVYCDHCVLQLYYTSANNCNPPGIVEYYRGPRGPFWWGKCPGEGQSEGGYRPWMNCGGSLFSEEYYKCADIRIHQVRRRKSFNYAQYEVKRNEDSIENPIEYVKLINNGSEIANITGGAQIYTEIENYDLCLEAIMRNVTFNCVYFSIENITSQRILEPPFKFPGSQSRWNNPITGRWFWVQVTAETEDSKLHHSQFSLFLNYSNGR